MSLEQRKLGAVVARILAVSLLVAIAGGASGDAVLTTADVVRFLKVGISERTILAELQTRGFAEALDQPREAALREAGASETLVVAVRRAAPAEKPPADAGGRAAPATGATASIPTFAARARTVRVPVSVVDKSGQPVIGLGVENFQISDDGRRQQVTLFSGERRALRIALALDVSSSMENKMRQVEGALRHFIALLEPADEIMVITFNNRVQVLQGFTSDHELLGRMLDMLGPFGPTALYDAAAEAIRRVSAGPAESKAVVLVTDGVDTDSWTSFDVLRELARRSEVPVFSIGLDAGSELRRVVRPPGPSGPGGGRPRFPGVGRGPGGGGRGGWPGGAGPGGGPAGGGSSGAGGTTPSGFDARPLQNLAEETGGRAEIVKGLEHYTPGSDGPGGGRLKAAVESIAMTLRHRYLLGYEPPEGRGGWRTIRVDVNRPAANARARKGYYSGA